MPTYKDPFADPDNETCSWCVTLVKDATLTELNDGARICRACKRDYPVTVNKIGVYRG